MPCGFENKLGILTKYSRMDYISKLKTVDFNMTSDDKFFHILNFKDFKGFKKVLNIKFRYKIGRVIGQGSFGQVRIAIHRLANLKCAIKIIRKDKIEQHQVLKDLIRGEL